MIKLEKLDKSLKVKHKVWCENNIKRRGNEEYYEYKILKYKAKIVEYENELVSIKNKKIEK